MTLPLRSWLVAPVTQALLPERCGPGGHVPSLPRGAVAKAALPPTLCDGCCAHLLFQAAQFAFLAMFPGETGPLGTRTANLRSPELRGQEHRPHMVTGDDLPTPAAPTLDTAPPGPTMGGRPRSRPPRDIQGAPGPRPHVNTGSFTWPWERTLRIRGLFHGGVAPDRHGSIHPINSQCPLLEPLELL